MGILMKVFDIKVYDNFDVIFCLALCKTKQEMIRQFKKIRPKEDISNVNGIFLAADYLTHDNFPGNFKSNVFGTIYMNLETLSDEIIVHECGHAAFCFERNIRRHTGNFDGEYCANGTGEEEEVFCYFLENAFVKVKQKIREYQKHG